MFDFMNVTTLRAVFAAEKPGQLPEYLGSTIRGILGHCFRDFVCHTPQVRCFSCNKQEGCSYVHNFCNTGGEGGAINPFVLYPHTEGKREWKPGDECVFDLTLFGHAALHPQIYMDALLWMEKKGWGAERIPFTLRTVTDPDTGRVIYAGGRTWLRNLSCHSMKIREGYARSALLHFDTPLRIVTGGKLFAELPFDMLMRFLVGRFELLTKVCTNMTMDWDQEEMLRQAAEIRIVDQQWRKIDFTRYSMNQKGNKLDLPSQTGRILYEGDLSPFLPFLEAGRYLHVGKNTTIGFGHYEVFYDEEVAER